MGRYNLRRIRAPIPTGYQHLCRKTLNLPVSHIKRKLNSLVKSPQTQFYQHRCRLWGSLKRFGSGMVRSGVSGGPIEGRIRWRSSFSLAKRFINGQILQTEWPPIKSSGVFGKRRKVREKQSQKFGRTFQLLWRMIILEVNFESSSVDWNWNDTFFNL